jgi:hypothetical protein
MFGSYPQEADSPPSQFESSRWVMERHLSEAEQCSSYSDSCRPTAVVRNLLKQEPYLTQSKSCRQTAVACNLLKALP